jgi:hypothetical protein
VCNSRRVLTQTRQPRSSAKMGASDFVRRIIHSDRAGNWNQFPLPLRTADSPTPFDSSCSPGFSACSKGKLQKSGVKGTGPATGSRTSRRRDTRQYSAYNHHKLLIDVFVLGTTPSGGSRCGFAVRRRRRGGGLPNSPSRDRAMNCEVEGYRGRYRGGT